MRTIVEICCALMLLGCASVPPGHERNASQQAQRPAWKRSCEEYAQGPVAIDYQDAPGGAAVLYRAQGGERGLRERAEQIARFHNSSAGKVGALRDLSSVPHRAHVEEVDGGVKLVLTVKTLLRTDLERMRWSVQQDVFTMQKKGCQSGHEAL